MSYYDNTVAEYNRKIREKENQIITHKNTINSLKRDLEELASLKGRINDGENAVRKASGETAKKILKAPELTRPFSFLNLSWFNGFLDVVQGNEFNQTIRAFASATKKVLDKIGVTNDEIDNQENQISWCYKEIDNLIQLRDAYIARMTESIPVAVPICATEEMLSNNLEKNSKTSSNKKK